jgi:hypothetical protein
MQSNLLRRAIPNLDIEMKKPPAGGFNDGDKFAISEVVANLESKPDGLVHSSTL